MYKEKYLHNKFMLRLAPINCPHKNITITTIILPPSPPSSCQRHHRLASTVTTITLPPSPHLSCHHHHHYLVTVTTIILPPSPPSCLHRHRHIVSFPLMGCNNSSLGVISLPCVGEDNGVNERMKGKQWCLMGQPALFCDISTNLGIITTIYSINEHNLYSYTS